MASKAKEELEIEVQNCMKGKEGKMPNEVIANNQMEVSGPEFNTWLMNIFGGDTGRAEWQESYDHFVRMMEEHYAGGSIEKIQLSEVFPVGVGLKSSLEDEELGKKDKNNWKHIQILYSDNINLQRTLVQNDKKLEEVKNFEDKKYGDLKFHW